MREVYRISREDIMHLFHTRETGLTEEEAEYARKKYGKNMITEEMRQSPLKIFFGRFVDFLVIILLIAAGVSAFLGDWESAVVILAVIVMNALLDTIQQLKAEKSLSSLKKLSAPNAKVLRNGEIKILGIEEVAVGDIVIIEAGDFVCADGRIIENASLKVSESALTGESLAVEKQECTLLNEVGLGDRINMVYSGSFVTYGRAEFVVTAVGMATEVGKIAALLKNTAGRKTPLQKNLDEFGRKLSVGILIICVLIFALGIIRGETIPRAFLFATALAVAAIPEALSSIVTIVLAFGTGKMAKENAIVRKLQAVEGLGSVSVVCSDKTGTLTLNKMTVMKCYMAGVEAEVNKQKNILKLTSKEAVVFQRLLEYGVLCSDATNYDGVEIGDPTEIAIVNLAAHRKIPVREIRNTSPRLFEIPFDSDRKLMSTIHNMEGELYMITKGAPDVILKRTSFIHTADGVRPIHQTDREDIRISNLEFSEQGLRVLAIAYKIVSQTKVAFEDECEYVFLGLMAMMDPPRKESKMAVAECIEAGIRPIMITGDHKITASAIAEKIGILTEGKRAVEGAEIEDMTDEELRNFVEDVSVYARVSPEHKIRIVRAWQEKGNIVAMTGDGVNDAPALKQADIGVAMGITGSEVAKDAAAVVLTDDNFATIVKAVENGRNVYANIKKSIKFLLSGNTAGILAVLYASIAGLPVPFAPVHLLFMNLLTDSLPAIALGLEPHSPDVMKEKPRTQSEVILTGRFLLEVVLEGVVLGGLTMCAYHIGLKESGVTAAATMAFATLCLSRLVHGFSTKSDAVIIWKKQLLNNKYLWLAFVTGFLLLNAVLLIPGLHDMFSVSALSMKQIGLVYVISFLNFPVVQMQKGLFQIIKNC